MAAAAVSYVALRFLAPVFNLNTFYGIFGQGLLAGLLGLAVFFLILKWYGSEELREIQAAWRHHFWRARAVAPEPESL